jgi:hypothetical protein
MSCSICSRSSKARRHHRRAALCQEPSVAGTTHLLWLRVGMLRHAPVPSFGEGRHRTLWMQCAIKSFGVSGFSPKVFLALLPPEHRTHPASPVGRGGGRAHFSSDALVHAGGSWRPAG